MTPPNEPNDATPQPDAVDPSTRDGAPSASDTGEHVSDERVRDGSNDEQRSGMQHRQSEQNQNENDRFDPSRNGRHDQLRRNDKRGRMGG